MKKIPIGLSDFKELIEEDYYYIDKTSMIKELIDTGSKITLVPRPRRFGKTLNMSMLKYFFEKSKEDNSHLFKHLYIFSCGKEYIEEQGKYPVIYLTFKDIKELDWETTFEKFKSIIADEYKRLKYIMDALEDTEKEYYDQIVNEIGSQSQYENSLKS